MQATNQRISDMEERVAEQELESNELRSREADFIEEAILRKEQIVRLEEEVSELSMVTFAHTQRTDLRSKKWILSLRITRAGSASLCPP